MQSISVQPADIASGSKPPPGASLDAALERWRGDLIDLTRRNPLLHLKPNRTSYLEIVQPDWRQVYDKLMAGGKGWLFHLPADAAKNAKKPASGPEARASELVTSATGRDDLLRILTNLYRRALTDYRERGLHILHLALGVLEWRDESDEPFRSPLLLLPVELKRHSLKDPFQLRATDEAEPIVNPALVARLKQDFDFSLPAPPGDWDEKKPEQYVAEVRSAIAGLPGWQVHDAAVLTLFSFFKGVIFQDLQDHAAEVGANPIVQALGGAAPAWLKADALAESELDRQEPQAAFHILDADGSQRLCLEAAARGESFVLIGPPGTGKSQTIANLISDRIASGKKVLFVSEKMAALEVVYKRLCAVGLGEFCLELHSHKANKREVIQELARCFNEKLAPGPQPGADDFARLKRRRDQLNAHAHALHQPRLPMNKSVWEVLAELPRWQDLPMIPLGLNADRLIEFRAEQLDELQQLLGRLQHHWHIRGEANYPWRGFKADRYSLQLRDEIISLIDRIRGKDDKLRAAAAQYAQQLGLSGPVAGLLKLGDLLENRPPHTQPGWLSIADFAGFCADFEKCAEQYQRLGQARAPLTERYGPALWKQPVGTWAKIEAAWKNAVPLLAPGDESGGDFLKLQQKLRAWAADTQKRIPGWLTELRSLEKWLAVPLSQGAGATVTSGDKLDPAIAALRAFVRLANLGVSDAPPEKSWLLDRQLAKDALAIVAASKPAFLRFKHHRQILLRTYSEKLFDLDLVRIGKAFAGPYQSWWSIFSWQYRKDRRAVAKCIPSEVLPSTVAHDMQLAGEAAADREKLETDKAELARLLGRYEKGLDTDIEAADRAARHAVEAHDLLGQFDCDRFPPKCVEALTAGVPGEKIRSAVKRLSESFTAWSHWTQEVQAILPMAHAPFADAALEECALSAVGNYAKALQASLNQFAGLADPLLGLTPPADMHPRGGRNPGPPEAGAGAPADKNVCPTMHAFIADLKQAEELLAFEAAQATEAERWTKLLGPAFVGVGTDWDALRKAITWTRRVRDSAQVMQGGITPALIQAASGVPPASRELRQALEQYQNALHSLELRYDPPGPMLDDKPLREQPPEAVFALLTKWRDRVGELADWVDWRYLPERFGHLGLKAFWDQLQQHDVQRERVVELFLKSFWSGWLDAIFQCDPVLAGYRRAEHEAALEEFRGLDRKIIAQGAARIIANLDPAQSKRDAGDADVALLMKEAHKKTKHWPLRQLFDAMPGLLLELKPCVLMSPLSVSQFLPGKMRFDLVVFDEASQILPEDAIGAIYRGRQLVVAGDNQQLPPTTFFQQNADDGGEEEETPLFESILDACLGAGMPQRMLRWHYRSQHENLIAFSNDSFYDGRLVTFPAPAPDQAGLGVRLHHVADGVYDRGGRRNNPREAQVVAQLALDHFRESPDRTLGIIAFSYPQMDAIADEIDRRLRDQPELERYFDGDRLEGFFVKNLETVQGDERDVIFLSVGYGPDAAGKIELNFGPLNREGGERRLNVAVTRARRQLVIVSSIRGRDLNLGAAPARGIAFLRRYLEFAERGVGAINADAAAPLSNTALHDDVRAEIRKLGLESDLLIGCGQCRLDIGVRDPKQAGRFLLGIEFDGPGVVPGQTARDRERLRPEVLVRLGWKLHRIAAADWIARKEEELARLRAALG